MALFKARILWDSFAQYRIIWTYGKWDWLFQKSVSIMNIIINWPRGKESTEVRKSQIRTFPLICNIIINCLPWLFFLISPAEIHVAKKVLDIAIRNEDFYVNYSSTDAKSWKIVINAVLSRLKVCRMDIIRTLELVRK